MSITWGDFGVYDHKNLPTDWMHVTSIESGCYDWCALHAFWSPSARRYFWLDASGCSCNSWGDYLSSEADFSNGSKSDLMAAIRSFADEYDYSVSAVQTIDAATEVSRFREVTS